MSSDNIIFIILFNKRFNQIYIFIYYLIII